MTAPKRKKARANGEGTPYQRKDGRWEAVCYVLSANGTRKNAADELAEKITYRSRGLTIATANSTVCDYLTYSLSSVAIHRLRESTRYSASTSSPASAPKKVARLTAKDVRTFLDRLRTTCQCCTESLDTERKQCCAVGECCEQRLSSLTVTYVRALGAQVGAGAGHTRRRAALQRRPQRQDHNALAETLPAPHSGRGSPLPRRSPRRPAPCAIRTRPPHRTPQGRTPRPPLGRSRPQRRHRAIHRSLQHTRTDGLTHLPTKTRASERRIALATECLHSLKELRGRQGVGLVVIKELLCHAHIGVYAHVRLRLQRRAIDTLNGAPGPANDAPDDPPAAAGVR